VDDPDNSHGVPFPVPVDSSDSTRGQRSTVGVEDILSCRFRTILLLSSGCDFNRGSGFFPVAYGHTLRKSSNSSKLLLFDLQNQHLALHLVNISQDIKEGTEYKITSCMRKD
jgi:hypothetical protein